MGVVVALAVLLPLVLAASVTVLARRDRRRRVRLANRFAAPGTLGALRARDDRSRY
ncbi:hypothetical protein [Streptomyces sp. NPDC051677]|uniref:hypothetical protein n=1 Tax=Streptomyces sp. NPDC051677 TaxID=3365669 RepID=UPI0037D6D330